MIKVEVICQLGLKQRIKSTSNAIITFSAKEFCTHRALIAKSSQCNDRRTANGIPHCVQNCFKLYICIFEVFKHRLWSFIFPILLI